MADPVYPLAENPEYNESLRAIQDNDPALASAIFTPLFTAMLNNTHFVKLLAEQVAGSLDSHVQDKENPHGATAAQVGAAAVSTRYEKMIGTAWGGGAGAWTQSIAVDGVTAENVVEVFLSQGAADAQDKAYNALQLRDGGQAAGSITLLARGSKNTVDIPITIIVRGDL